MSNTKNIVKVDDFEDGYVEFINPTIRQAEVLDNYVALCKFADHIYDLTTTLPNDQDLGRSMRSFVNKLLHPKV